MKKTQTQTQILGRIYTEHARPFVVCCVVFSNPRPCSFSLLKSKSWIKSSDNEKKNTSCFGLSSSLLPPMRHCPALHVPPRPSFSSLRTAVSPCPSPSLATHLACPQPHLENAMLGSVLMQCPQHIRRFNTFSVACAHSLMVLRHSCLLRSAQAPPPLLMLTPTKGGDF